MRSFNEHSCVEDSNSGNELRLIEELEGTPEISQRDLSKKLGVALGLTNTLIRNMVKKGYIRANQAGWKRWLYAITPEGFSHKLQLTFIYVRRVLDDYGKVRKILRQELAPLALHQESEVAIYGTGDFAELVFLGLKEIGIEEIDIYGQDSESNSRFLGIPVLGKKSLRTRQYEKVVVAVLGDSRQVVSELMEQGLSEEELVIFFSNGRIKNNSQETT